MTELDDAQLREIFDRVIRPVIDNLGAPSPAGSGPLAVFVGGQPGAGKSRAISRVKEKRPEITEVIGDDFRNFHPDYGRLMEETPLEMPGATAQASGR